MIDPIEEDNKKMEELLGLQEDYKMSSGVDEPYESIEEKWEIHLTLQDIMKKIRAAYKESENPRLTNG